MSTVSVILEDGTTREFVDNTLGHQVGYGACQIMLEDGTQYVFNNFKEISIIPNEEERATFVAEQERAKAIAAERMRVTDEAIAEMKEERAATAN